MRTAPNDRADERAALTSGDGAGPERRCVLTGAVGARAAMIRLALGPDGQVAPDVLAKAPGRGAWIAVDRMTLDAAVANGKLKAALARLGLEARAGTLVTGADRIDAAARAGKVSLLLHAADAGADGRAKRDQSWRVGRGEEGSGLAGRILPVDRGPLSMALGRENVVHIALVDRRATDRVTAVLDRWQTFASCGRDAQNPAMPPDEAAVSTRAAPIGRGDDDDMKGV